MQKYSLLDDCRCRACWLFGNTISPAAITSVSLALCTSEKVPLSTQQSYFLCLLPVRQLCMQALHEMASCTYSLQSSLPVCVPAGSQTDLCVCGLSSSLVCLLLVKQLCVLFSSQLCAPAVCQAALCAHCYCQSSSFVCNLYHCCVHLLFVKQFYVSAVCQAALCACC